MEVEQIRLPQRGLASFILRSALPALAVLLAILGGPAWEGEAAEIRVTVDFPTDGSSFARPVPRALIAGHAQVHGALMPALDLAIVIDRSGSTANPTGADIDGDGMVGEAKKLLFPFSLKHLLESRSTDPDDSVLAAELVGARNLLKSLDLTHTRVSVISFGKNYVPRWGKDDLLPDARLEQPLTSDPQQIQEALVRIGASGALGGTNIAAAIREATLHLTGPRASSPAQPGAKKVILLLTDGFPSFPAGAPTTADPEDIILALRAASLARQAGVEVHTYALGPKVTSAPFALTEIARITGGRFNPISDPAQIIYRLKEFTFAQLKSLGVKNATLGQPAEQVALGPDGAYIAVVPVKAGINQIEVTGQASDGTQGGASVLLNYLSGGEPELALRPTKREMALRPTPKSFDELQLELEKEKKRWLELNHKTKELELKAKEKGKPQPQLEIDLEVK
ncbi:MAG: VWA domain-containing protein [Candidatus Tectomicrobia bacterium]|uniref:VWA domain-containing protein n=1 Tax=Tectimicrobiota bacterium TaxID=2528274 RepID=A0A932G1S6_UNCTE|nr:VWA domain-containing protein [Candidatus Tectomicrobia bacterium]